MAKDSRVKIIISTGGTGGHLFPAQALARDLIRQNPNVEIVFLGAKLSRNPYFDQPQFQSRDISSATPYKQHFFTCFKALFAIQKGLMQALSFFRRFKPDVVIGFGSFYSFPSLLAAKLKRVPIILFESNVFPGRVNRFCSRWAKISAVQFFLAQLQLKGNTICVRMPLLQRSEGIAVSAARRYFHLDEDTLTFLVFGGSQGAQPINRHFCGALKGLLARKIDFQVIHMVGCDKRAGKLREVYAEHGVRAFVKPFEKQMHLAWTAADLSISRAGSGTLAEQIEFGVPGILIPFPRGSENHQTFNAAFVAEEIKGAIHLSESTLSSEKLVEVIDDLLASSQQKLKEMKRALELYKKREENNDFANVILQMLKR